MRSAIVNGARTASGVCVGIAVANGIYIGLAISGVALMQSSSFPFSVLKWGAAYLAWLGWRFLTVRGETIVPLAENQAVKNGGARRLVRECRTGFLSTS